MKKTNQPLTIASISKLMDKKLLPIHHQLTQLLGETTYTRNEVNSLRAEMQSEIGTLRSEMDKRFDQNEKDHQEILEAVKEFVSGGYNLLDKRITKLEHRAFAT